MLTVLVLLPTHCVCLCLQCHHVQVNIFSCLCCLLLGLQRCQPLLQRAVQAQHAHHSHSTGDMRECCKWHIGAGIQLLRQKVLSGLLWGVHLLEHVTWPTLGTSSCCCCCCPAISLYSELLFKDAFEHTTCTIAGRDPRRTSGLPLGLQHLPSDNCWCRPPDAYSHRQQIAAAM